MIYLLPMEHQEEPPPPQNVWRLFSPCRDEAGEEGHLLDAIDDLGDNMQEALDHLLRHITKLAATGKPWKELIPDADDLHDVGDAKIKLPSGRTVSEKIWQFRHGQMRLLWCYGHGKQVVILTHAMAKSSKKIKKADLEAAEQVMKEYFCALENGQIKIIGDDDHERTLATLFPESKGKPGVQEKRKTGGRRG